MRQAACRELHSYWNNLRGTRTAPERADVDPAAIRGILANTFMLEVDPGHRYPIRLSGARVSALFVEELKGHSFLELWSDRDRISMRALLDSVIDGRIPALAGASAAAPGRAPVDCELLLLPLRHHGKTHARVMGCLAPANVPNWYGLVPTEPLALRSMRLLRDTPPVPAQDGAHIAPQPGVERRGHLTVISGGR